MARVVGEDMRAYYERRAREYDDWWLGSGLFAARDRPGWAEEVRELVAALGSLRRRDPRRGLRHRLPHPAPARIADGARTEPGHGRDHARAADRSGGRRGRRRPPPLRRRRLRARLHQPLLRPPAAGGADGLRGRGPAGGRRARGRRLGPAPRRPGRGLAGARAQRRLAPPGLQALVPRRGAGGGARRWRGAAGRELVRPRPGPGSGPVVDPEGVAGPRAPRAGVLLDVVVDTAVKAAEPEAAADLEAVAATADVAGADDSARAAAGHAVDPQDGGQGRELGAARGDGLARMTRGGRGCGGSRPE